MAQNLNEKLITVSATAEKKVSPDEVIYSVDINQKAATFEKAVESLDDIIKSARNIMKKEGIDEKEIKTTTYTINKNFYWDQGKRFEDGYMASSRIEAKDQLNTKKMSKLLARFAKESPDLNLNLSFSVSDDLLEKTKNELLTDAIRRAKDKAFVICGALGKNLRDIKSVDYSEGGQRPIYQKNYADMRAMRTSSAMQEEAPIENVKEIEIQLSVHTVWTID